MGQFDLSLGCLLFSSWANMILLTLEIAQIYQYFQKYPKDNLFNKGSVIFALCSDLTTVFACLSVNYLYLVTHWGSNDYLLTQPWCIAVYVVSTAISSAITQTWLSRMVYNLTKQWIWLPIIWLFIVGGLTGAAATGGLLVIDASYAARAGLIKWVTLWLAGCVVADTVITVVLVAKFRTMKSTFQDTKSLLRRLSLEAVRNGSITTVMTIITLVIFTQQPGENSAVMIEMTIGRVYTLSMLSNLNNRSMLTGDSQLSGSRKAGGNNTHHDHQTPTMLRIRQDVETHYQIDSDPIQMGAMQKGREAAANSDGTSEVDLVVKTKTDEVYAGY
ncbi:unnamed protein product [Mycena citricolor]|uniref:DUF6534 domain-containing protein n=1 Tax=Mycena citricolor TaxID=2018698 RepID=A0AAD2H6Y4_9AGAR|nr:unnamed protein product [Mycena citricolor]CAK5283890.1 unnamed protein product [Mycena citricolor]